MLLISNIKLPVGYTDSDITAALARRKIPKNASWKLRKLSLDARKKDDLHYLCSVEVSFSGEEDFLRKNRNRDITSWNPGIYRPVSAGDRAGSVRPVIVGAGPAGLFAARVLAEAGLHPVLIERGAPVEERTRDVETFWKDGRLKPDSNVQFGEGGAGTFSDGKLATQIKDRGGRIRQVLTWFVEAGADPSILYVNKPHIGTDVLKTVVRNLRLRILEQGGEVCFHTKAERLITDGNGHLTGVSLRRADGSEEIRETRHLILAVGHSARDTFHMLKDMDIPLQAKSFAVGLRIEHPQSSINTAQYGAGHPAGLPAADYKLTGTAPDGRGVYSFCMCPGGQVVNASSEEERICVNGMSLAARNGRNANSALVVSVTPEDFGSDPLSGIAFQRKLEHLAWEAGEGHIPVQLLGDFSQNTVSRCLGDVEPDLCGGWQFGNLRRVLPEAVSRGLLASIPSFDRKISGYGRPDAVLSGVESRTSSPVRILRDEHFESSLRGLFPCGEGAGYAGGITSAAVDGMKVAEEILRRTIPEEP